MLGVLLIDKPKGITSHDVVHQVRRRLGTKRVGHSGTLDPLATGLLVLAVGPATRFLQYLPLEPKVYRGVIQFGVETNTHDCEGEIVREAAVPTDLQPQLAEVLPRFTGLISQIPPMYSAVKHQGKALYHYARKGETIEREPRNVHIDRIEVLSIEGPRAEVRITCSGGTYIRTLASDIGREIGCGAHLADLVREQVGKFRIEDAIGLEDVAPESLIDLVEALPPMRLMTVNATQEAAIREGQAIGNALRSPSGTVGLVSERGDVIGIAKVGETSIQPECVLPREAAYGSV